MSCIALETPDQEFTVDDVALLDADASSALLNAASQIAAFESKKRQDLFRVSRAEAKTRQKQKRERVKLRIEEAKKLICEETERVNQEIAALSNTVDWFERSVILRKIAGKDDADFLDSIHALSVRGCNQYVIECDRYISHIKHHLGRIAREDRDVASAFKTLSGQQ